MSEPSTAVHLDHISQIAITVSDLARAKLFYQHALGMQFLFDAGTMAFFQCGAVRVLIGVTDQPLAPSTTILYFKVPGIDSAYASLLAGGVTFPQPPHLVARMPDHELWLAEFMDPDGNPLALLTEKRS